ncbi:MAG: DNA polymerase IV [Chitinophagales bacterium]|nr:DNA polymerase IV [Chitinophagales bacterium]MDW8427095.1 DNA polymerase IV [Chitinophagales bacterium]
MNSSERTIVHLDLDSFFVAVARQMNPKLRQRPVLVGGTGERAVVAACSYEARHYGIYSGMSLRLARRLCPDAYIVQGDYELYVRKSDEVAQIIRMHAPVYEQASIDEFYLDLTGMDRFWGCRRWALELWQRVKKETGLPCSFGLSINKTVAKVATGVAKPDNHLEVERGTERTFLAPLSIRQLPMVGEKTYQLLRRMGVERIGTLQLMPVELLEKLLGRHGRLLWQKAQGQDDTPVRPAAAQRSLSAEETLDADTIDTDLLWSRLLALTEGLLYELRREGYCTGCVTVKIRYSNFDTHTMQRRLPCTCSDHEVLPVVRALFDRLYQRRLRVRLVGVRFSQLTAANQQLSLFAEGLRTQRLYEALDRLRHRFGSRSIGRAAGFTTAPADS